MVNRNGRRWRRDRGHGKASPAPAVSLCVEVNGTMHTVTVAPMTTLLEVVRHHLRLTGTKLGCGRGECGACTVLVGDRAVTSCLVLASVVSEPVTTIEGIAAGAADLRAAFADTGGFQCGYCTPGQLVTAEAYLRSVTAVPAEDEVRRALAGNICRCTGYAPIIDAVLATARERLARS